MENTTQTIADTEDLAECVEEVSDDEELTNLDRDELIRQTLNQGIFSGHSSFAD